MPLSTPQEGHTGHIEFSSWVRNIINSKVYANDPDFATLQDAVDYAVGGPASAALTAPRYAQYDLHFPRGIYTITTPIKIYGVIGMEITASPGAVFVVAANIESVFDVVGCAHVHISGGEIRAQSGYIVQNGVWIRQDYSLANFVTTGINLRRMRVTSSGDAGTGHFVRAVRIGNGNTYQCDQIKVDHVLAYGKQGFSTHGIYIHGGWGNLLNITCEDSAAAGVDVAFEAYAANRISFLNCDADGSNPGIGGGQLAFRVMSAQFLIQGGRAEAFDRLAHFHSNDNVNAVGTLADYSFHGDEMSPGDEAVIQYRYGGQLTVRNVQLNACAVTPYLLFDSPSAVCTLQGSIAINGVNRPTGAALVSGSVRGSMEYSQGDDTMAQVSTETVTF